MSEFGFINKNSANYEKFCVILADGTKVYRFVAEECAHCNDNYEEQFFTNQVGDRIDPPDLTNSKDCEKSKPDCVESQEWTYGIDNTGTRFNDVANYCLELSDGSTLEWSQDGSSNSWTPQLNEWSINIQSAADDAGLDWVVEPRYVDTHPTGDVTSIDGTINGPGGTPSGLPGAPSIPIAVALADGGMSYRYVNFQICPGQPVPVRAFRKTSQQFGDEEFILTSAGAVLGPIQKFWLCTECSEGDGGIEWLKEDPENPGELIAAESGEIPNCYEPCGTLALAEAPPDRACTFEIDVACDNNNSINTEDFTNTITRRATICNGEQIAVDFFEQDPDDPAALIAYEMQGDFVDCATGEPIELPEIDGIIIDCEENAVSESYDSDVRIIGSKYTLPVRVLENCCVNPASLECIKKRIFDFVYDNGITPGSSTNDGESAQNLVHFNQTFTSLGWETGAGTVGAGDAIGAYTGWGNQLTGWRDFGTTYDPYNSVNAFNFYGAPTWRGWSVTGCNPSAKYGIWELLRDDGVTFKVFPVRYTETIERVYRSQEIDCDGNITTRYWNINEDGKTYTEIETPDDVECFVSCDYIFESVILPGAESPCETTEQILCDRVDPDDSSQDVQFVQVKTNCNGDITLERFTLDSYTNATNPDELVEYEVVGEIFICGTNDSPAEIPPECNDFEYVGKLWKITDAEPGSTVEWWGTPTAPAGDNSAPHGNVTDIFSIVGGELAHVNGDPVVTYTESSFFVDTLSDGFVAQTGGTTTSETSGTDQFVVSGYVVANEPILLRDSSPSGRNGERGAFYIDKCCSNNLELLAEQTADTNTVRNLFPAGVVIPVGIHFIQVAVSDSAVWADLGLEASTDDGFSWKPFSSFKNKQSYICIPVEKCKDSGTLRNSETGEVVTVGEFDLWCEPPSCGDSGGNGGTVSVSNFPEDQLVSIDIPTISVIDYEGNSDSNTDGPVGDLVNDYTTDIDALPIGVPAGTVLPVQLSGFTQEYYQGDGNLGEAHISAKVALPTSAVIRTEEQVIPKTVNSSDATFTNTQTVASGFVAMTVQVRSGEVTINGATYDSCTPFVLPPLHCGGGLATYPAYTITPVGSAEYNLSSQRIN